MLFNMRVKEYAQFFFVRNIIILLLLFNPFSYEYSIIISNTRSMFN